MQTDPKATGVIDFDRCLGLCPLEHICQHVRLAQFESLLSTFRSREKRSATDLAVALSEFQRILSPDQLTQLNSLQSCTPTANDVLSLTNDIVAKNSDRKSRLFASRVQPLLVSIQQYCTVLDTYAGSHPTVALVWGSIKLVLLVRPGRQNPFSYCLPLLDWLGYIELCRLLRQAL